MTKPREYKEDYVVKLLDVKKNSTRDVVIHVTTQIQAPQALYAFYDAAFKAKENKAKPGEVVIRVSVKGYS
jgi:hypothetical protein